MILISEAQRIVLEHTKLLPVESVSLNGALGRTLAQTVYAPDSLPPFPASVKVASMLGIGGGYGYLFAPKLQFGPPMEHLTSNT